MLILSTFATVIASQAVITGAFSLTRQAIQLGLVPRFRNTPYLRKHRRPDLHAEGQLAAVHCGARRIFAFRTSSNLAAAYGVSVTATMVITNDDGVLRRLEAVEVAALARCGTRASTAAVRAGVFRRKHSQAARGRLGADVDRGLSGSHHVHMGARNAGSRQGDKARTRPISTGWCASSKPSRRIACRERPCS